MSTATDDSDICARPPDGYPSKGGKFKFYSVGGPCFSLGNWFPPAGYGRTIILGPHIMRVRRLSLNERWVLAGGILSEFDESSYTTATIESIFLNNNPPNSGLT